MTSARTRSLAPLAVLLAVTGGVVLFAVFGVARKDEAAAARKDADAKLYAFAAPRVKAVTVTAKGDTTRVARDGDGWRVDAPLRAPAERATVDALVDAVAGLRRKASAADKADDAALKRFGFSPPRVTVALEVEGGAEERLALGDDNPFDGSVFVRTTAGAVELVDGGVKWALDRNTFDLREKRLLPFEDGELARVEVTTPRLAYALVRDGEAWRLDAPVKERADAAAVSRVLGAVRALRAVEFLPAGDPRTAALQRPRWKVRLVDAKGAARSAALAPGPATGVADVAAPLLARVDGSAEAARVAQGAEKDLEQDLFALRDKRVLHVDRDAVARVTLRRGADRLEVVRDGAAQGGAEAWRLTAPREGKVQAGRVASLLWSVTSLQARRFAEEGAAAPKDRGLGAPALEVILAGADGKELDRLLVSAEREGRAYAKAASSPRVHEIDPAALAPLPRGPEDLEEKPAPTKAATSAK